MLIRAFLLSDGPAFERRMTRLLGPLPVHLSGRGTKRGFWARLGETTADLVIASATALPEPAAGAVKALRQLPEGPEVVVVSAQEDPAQRAALLSAGAIAVLYAALGDDVLGETLAALVTRRRQAVVRSGDPPPDNAASHLSDFVSMSASMLELVETARRVANADTSLLIVGETGVGKEHLAKAIHAHSPRAAGPFVAFNCAAIPEPLLESELFGHERGAFTGAHRARRGYFELAHHGTLFLDELGDMPAPAQAKLLRVLQEHRIQPLGSERPIDIDVRIIGATNRDLADEIASHRFRSDLYYRLGVVTLSVPPLRDRREDIPHLVEYYRAHFAHRLRRPVATVTPEAIELLSTYRWPGNVRELINVVERAVLLCEGTAITAADLPDARRPSTPDPTPGAADLLGAPTATWSDLSWGAVRELVLETAERRYLEEVLRATGGRIGDTARRAGMTARSLSRKMRHHGLAKEQFRTRSKGPPPR